MVIDSQKKEEIVNIGGEGFFLEMLDKFIAQAIEILDQIRSAKAGGNADQAKSLLHKLKGSSLTIGADDFARHVLRAYEKAQAGVMVEDEDLGLMDACLVELQAHRKTLQ